MTPEARKAKVAEIKGRAVLKPYYVTLHGTDYDFLLAIVAELEAELDANANMISSLQWQVETEQRLGVERRAEIAKLEAENAELHAALALRADPE